jgi:LPS-assembly lipoprotein
MRAAVPSSQGRDRAAALRPALLLLLAALSLPGCGFRLQGRHELPRSLAAVRIDTQDLQSDFYTALRGSLLIAGSRLEGAPEAVATIRILEDGTSERVLTVSARNTPTAYELSYRVKVSVEYQGRELMPPEEHILGREYSFDERALLAKQRERDALEQALAEDLAALIMRRLAAL